MRTPQTTVQKTPFYMNGDVLMALTYMVSGVLITREGGLKLWELWIKLSAYLPFSFQDQAAQKILPFLPVITKTFIITVSSVCAVIIGVLWILSGLFEAVQARARPFSPAGFARPDLAAESLRTGAPQYWRSPPWLVRIMAVVWPKARFMTPVSYDLLGEVLVAFWKILFMSLLIALMTFLLQWAPALLEKRLNVTLNLAVPSAMPLYYVLGLMAAINLIIGLTLVPLGRQLFHRSSKEIIVRGRGDPHLFFALVEEGCLLLNPRGFPDSRPVRLEQASTPRAKGTLVETFPTIVRSFSRPVGYLCLPVMAVLLVLGFSRLVQFQMSAQTMSHGDFLALQLPAYLLEIVFAFSLILCGLHVSEWARNLLGICRFKSALIFCRLKRGTGSESVPVEKHGKKRLFARAQGQDPIDWQTAQGVDEEFVDWAKAPEAAKQFRVEITWADVVSESASPDADRHLTIMERTEALDGGMARILELPFQVKLECEEPLPAIERPPESSSDLSEVQGGVEKP